MDLVPCEPTTGACRLSALADLCLQVGGAAVAGGWRMAGPEAGQLTKKGLAIRQASIEI